MKPTYTSFDFQENTLALGIYLTGLPKGAGGGSARIEIRSHWAGEVFLPVDYIPSDYASGTGPRNLVTTQIANRDEN